MGHVEEGAKRHSSLRHETLLLFAADLLLPWFKGLGTKTQKISKNCRFFTLKEPSLARSVLKPFKMEQKGEGEGAKRHYSLCHETLLLFAADLLLRWSSVASSVRLPKSIVK